MRGRRIIVVIPQQQRRRHCLHVTRERDSHLGNDPAVHGYGHSFIEYGGFLDSHGWNGQFGGLVHRSHG
jgi:hypothetical protein